MSTRHHTTGFLRVAHRPDGEGVAIVSEGENHRHVATAFGPERNSGENAAELVRRWNAHDELVTVAAEAAQILERHHAETGEHVRGANIAALHAAVRNARGGK